MQEIKTDSKTFRQKILKQQILFKLAFKLQKPFFVIIIGNVADSKKQEYIDGKTVPGNFRIRHLTFCHCE